MSNAPLASITLTASVILVALMFLNRGRTNIIAFVAAYFVFFAYGPVVNLLLGGEVYRGIVHETVDEAAFGFLLAVGGMFLADRVLPQRRHFDFTKWLEDDRGYPLLKVFLGSLAFYALAAIGSAGPSILNLTKHGRIDALGPYHRTYLFLQIMAVALYFLARRSKSDRLIYHTNIAVYVAYCVLSAERDFIFAIFALMLVRNIVVGVPRLTRTVGATAALLVAAVLIVSSRSGKSADAESVLNQGSILFVDTYVHSIATSEATPFGFGGTYINSLVNLLPSFVHSTDFSLARWLRDSYAPTSHSGYGFSLTAEAYLNFGYIGILPVFMAIALALRAITNRLDRGLFYSYFTVLFTTTLMYSMRGDSLQLVKSLIYGAGLYLVIVSVRRARHIRVSGKHGLVRKK